MAKVINLKSLVQEYGDDAANAVKPVREVKEFRDVQVFQVLLEIPGVEEPIELFPKPVPKGQATRMASVLGLIQKVEKAVHGKNIIASIEVVGTTIQAKNKNWKGNGQ